MYRFAREEIFPLFLSRRIPVNRLAREAGVDAKTVEKAINGLPVTARVIAGIAAALRINPLDAEFIERRG